MLTRSALLALALGFGGVSSLPAETVFPPSFYYPERRWERMAREWVRLYLRREATERDILVIVNQLRRGVSINAVQANILASPEYFRRCQWNLNIWARQMIADALGRPATPQEAALVTSIALRQGRYAAALITLESQTGFWWGW